MTTLCNAIYIILFSTIHISCLLTYSISSIPAKILKNRYHYISIDYGSRHIYSWARQSATPNSLLWRFGAIKLSLINNMSMSDPQLGILLTVIVVLMLLQKLHIEIEIMKKDAMVWTNLSNLFRSCLALFRKDYPYLITCITTSTYLNN